MEKKQTAVDFIEAKLEFLNIELNQLSEIYDILRKAKKIEIQQHEETWVVAWNESAKSRNFTNYYNETYGGQDE